MRKSIVTFLLICVSLGAAAVEMPKQGFGFHIGWAQPILRLNSPSNPSTAKDSLTLTTKMKGLKAGLVYDASYIAGFGSSMGINYTLGVASTRWNKKNLSFSERSQTLYHELEVFVDWQYKFEVAQETYLILYTGPTIQCGLAHNTRTFERNDVTNEIKPTDVSRYSTEDPDKLLSRFNVTWGVGAGFQFQRYFLRGGYDFGLINPYANDDFQNGYHTRGRLDQWSIKIGMYFWYQE